MAQQQIETIEQRGKRLEQTIGKAQAARDEAWRQVANALETAAASEQLLSQARSNFTAFKTGLMADFVRDVERLRLPPANA